MNSLSFIKGNFNLSKEGSLEMQEYIDLYKQVLATISLITDDFEEIASSTTKNLQEMKSEKFKTCGTINKKQFRVFYRFLTQHPKNEIWLCLLIGIKPIILKSYQIIKVCRFISTFQHDDMLKFTELFVTFYTYVVLCITNLEKLTLIPCNGLDQIFASCKSEL